MSNKSDIICIFCIYFYRDGFRVRFHVEIIALLPYWPSNPLNTCNWQSKRSSVGMCLCMCFRVCLQAFVRVSVWAFMHRLKWRCNKKKCESYIKKSTLNIYLLFICLYFQPDPLVLLNGLMNSVQQPHFRQNRPMSQCLIACHGDSFVTSGGAVMDNPSFVFVALS